MRETPEDELPEFAQRIRRFRKALGLTQRHFAAALDVPEATVYRWEHGKSMPGFRHLETMHRLGQEKSVYTQIFPILTFESVFFLSDVWKEEMREGHDRIFLRLVITDALGVTAQVLATVASHKGNLLRVAGFQRVAPGSNQSVLRLLFDLPRECSLAALETEIKTLKGVISTDIPAEVRPPLPSTTPSSEGLPQDLNLW